MTSLLRDEVSLPMRSAFSRRMTSCPAMARRRAMARPTTPAPMTTVSTSSMGAAPGIGCRRHLGHSAAPAQLLTQIAQRDRTCRQDRKGIDAGGTADQHAKADEPAHGIAA